MSLNLSVATMLLKREQGDLNTYEREDLSSALVDLLKNVLDEDRQRNDDALYRERQAAFAMQDELVVLKQQNHNLGELVASLRGQVANTTLKPEDYLDMYQGRLYDSLPSAFPNKIPVIKQVREDSGLGLKEAKEIVDAWVASGALHMPEANPFTDASVAESD